MGLVPNVFDPRRGGTKYIDNIVVKRSVLLSFYLILRKSTSKMTSSESWLMRRVFICSNATSYLVNRNRCIGHISRVISLIISIGD